MSKRVWNFAPGPATLPLSALERAQGDLIDFAGTGVGVCEHSHRGKEYEAVHNEAISLLRALLSVPDTHDVLLLQGGAHHQFAMIPMNFLSPGQSADYVLTGTWAERAFEECKTVGTARVASDTSVPGTPKYKRVPTPGAIDTDPKAAYLHFTSNNTIYGTQFTDWPETPAPLVCDMSSDLGWRAFDVSKFALIYCCAQKNLGPSGVTIVIVRKDWVEKGRKDIPKILRYSTHAKENSLYNTAATFPIYLMRNVLAVLAERGIARIEADNREKARLIYAEIDRQPELYRAEVEKASRSAMNAVFTLPSEELEKRFLAGAQKKDMVSLKGHRSVGGIRVSMYNAMPVEGVQLLADYMREFAASV